MSSVTRVKQGRSGAAVTVSCRVGVAGRSVAWEGVGAGGDAALPSTGERREPGGGGGAAEAGRRRAGRNAYDRDAGGRRAVVHAGAGGNKHHRLRRGNGGADAAGGSASGGWSRAAAANENVLLPATTEGMGGSAVARPARALKLRKKRMDRRLGTCTATAYLRTD
jgi:hypothetical protein